MPSAPLNPVYALEPEAPPGTSAKLIDEVLVRTKTPWMLITTSESSKHHSALIEEFKLECVLTMPAMLLFLEDWRPGPVPHDLDIRQAVSSAELAEALKTGAQGFGAPVDFFDSLISPLASSGQEAALKLYLGSCGAEPASISGLHVSGKVAGIYFVSTRPEFRGRGYGEALTAHAVEGGKKRGCTTSYLQASKMGRPIYEKMGYKTVEDLQCWAPPTVREDMAPH